MEAVWRGKIKQFKVTEKELIAGCIQEKPEYQKELFRRYSGKMMSVCMRYCRHRMEAEDIIQDAFIKIFNNLHRFQFTGSFEGWIRRIVINTALKKISKKSFTHEQYGVENAPSPQISPTVHSTLGKEDLLRIIANLPTGYRLVFNLYAIEGYSHSEIAEMLSIGESTSRSQLAKARKLLQKEITRLQKKVI